MALLLVASLLLLTLSLDLKEIIKLGPKAGIMMLTGTAGIVIGGPIALCVTQHWLPDDAWQGMAALAGSWIGGAANMIAIQKSVGASEDMIGLIVVVDTAVAGVWMGLLIYLAGRHQRIDRRTKADTGAIRHLEKKMADFQASVARIPSLTDLIVLLALAFGSCWACYYAGLRIDEKLTPQLPESLREIISQATWTVILVTTVGLVLSFTPARRYEGAGASRLGSVLLYLLVACIGAHADLREIVKAPAFMVMGVVWSRIGIRTSSVSRQRW